ncbi:MAG: pyrimidine reductase family protein [Oryzihumus sp.]
MALMRLLLPHPDAPSDDEGDGRLSPEALAELYEYPRSATRGVPWVRANFVTTLDGAATGSDGRSGSINTGADREVFGLLRALADVVLVGAGTARIEGYRPIAARAQWQDVRGRSGRADPPVLAVASRSAQLPPLLRERPEGAGEVILLTCERAPEEAVEAARAALGADNVIVRGGDGVDLDAAIKELAARGLTRILCEGGPQLMHDLVSAGHLDELCLTIAPTIVAGDHTRITAGPSIVEHLVPRVLIESEGTVLGRWVRADAATG